MIIAPLVPLDADISGLDGFMLDVQRLFASELWAMSSGDEFKAAISLWGRAWQQKPPGSLPNDDKVLAAFSGAGSKWAKVRAVALRGFVECSDGRLYHRVLCEDVLRAVRKRAEFKERTKAATEARKQKERDRYGQRYVAGYDPHNGTRNGACNERSETLTEERAIQGKNSISQDRGSLRPAGGDGG